ATARLAAGRSDRAPHLAFFVGGSGGVVAMVALHATAIAAFALALQESPALVKTWRRALASRVTLAGPALGLVGSAIMISLGLVEVGAVLDQARGWGINFAIGCTASVLGVALYSASLVAVADKIVPPHPVRPRWERPWYVEAVIGLAAPVVAVALGGPSLGDQVGLRVALPAALLVPLWVAAVWAAVLASSAAAVAFTSRGARPTG
ncbi:MAG: hypothetical protein ACAI25_18715, partial [Planctomycetota bacterium]